MNEAKESGPENLVRIPRVLRNLIAEIKGAEVADKEQMLSRLVFEVEGLLDAMNASLRMHIRDCEEICKAVEKE